MSINAFILTSTSTHSHESTRAAWGSRPHIRANSPFSELKSPCARSSSCLLPRNAGSPTEREILSLSLWVYRRTPPQSVRIPKSSQSETNSSLEASIFRRSRRSVRSSSGRLSGTVSRFFDKAGSHIFLVRSFSQAVCIDCSSSESDSSSESFPCRFFRLFRRLGLC